MTPKPQSGRPATLTDVASAAGVSRALASIVMRGAGGASDETRARVLAIAAELGYRPDARARLLRRTSPHLIGLVFRIESRFHADLVEVIHDATVAAGYDLVLGGAHHGYDERRTIEMLLGYRCDAIILLGTSQPESVIEEMAGATPVVTVTRRLWRSIPNVDSVVTDDDHGMRLLVDHLRELGHRAIAHVDGGKDVKATDRRRAFLAAAAARGSDVPPVFTGGEWAEEAGPATRAILSAPERPTAIVAYNDDLAWGLIGELSRAGVQVPADVSVTGYDHARAWLALPQQLTTVRQDARTLGRLSVERAVARLEGGAADRSTESLLTPSLVVGHTTGPAQAMARHGGARPIS